MIIPKTFQLEAVEKFRNEPAVLIGDSMGVGKTVTAIQRDFTARSDKKFPASLPTLIICEKSMLETWKWHLMEMGVPESSIYVIDPGDRTGFEQAVLHLRSADRYFVCHYDAIWRMPSVSGGGDGRAVQRPEQRPKFGHVILDECHLIKNPHRVRPKGTKGGVGGSRRTIAVKRIQTVWKTALTGTPIDDKPQDIWSILNWLDKKRWSSYHKFIRTYLELEQDWSGYWKIVGVKTDEVRSLHKEIAPYYIRRRLPDVNASMPPKIHVPPIWVDMTKRQARAYRQMDKALMAELAISNVGGGGVGGDGGGGGTSLLVARADVARLVRLQQLLMAEGIWLDSSGKPVKMAMPSPKASAFFRILEDLGGEPIVLFDWFQPFIDLIEDECQKRGVSCVSVTGKTPLRDRVQAVDSFQNGGAQVFAGTIAAAGRGITLTRASHLIFTSLSWRPEWNKQAEDRIWRITQDKTCLIYTIRTRKSIEVYQDARLMSKASMNDDFLMDGDEF